MKMKKSDFLAMLTRACVSDTKYVKGGWGKWVAPSWQFDCVCLIKGILWGWIGDMTKDHGGAIYKANGVPDCTCAAMFNACENKRTFKARCIKASDLQSGELLYMKGHVGIYVGDGMVIDSTPSGDGVAKRTLAFQPWTGSGLLPWVEYEEKKPVIQEVFELNQCPLFSSYDKLKPSCFISGSYFRYDDSTFGTRVRICKKPEDRGNIRKVVGYIEKEEIKR